MFRIEQTETGFDVLDAQGETVGQAETYDGAVAVVASALTAHLTAAPGDAPGLLDQAWRSEAVFQEDLGDRDFSSCLFSWLDPTVSTMPLMLQRQNAPGHLGADLGGFVTAAEGQDPVLLRGRFYDSAIGAQTRDMLLDERRFGVSVDPGSFDAACSEEDEFGDCVRVTFHAYEIAGLTVEPFPGMQRAFIELEREPAMSVAASAPVAPPRAWFEMPEPARGDDRLVPQRTGGFAVPLTITDEGQVYGHVADRLRCHIGYPGRCRTAPTSASGYQRFHLGSVTCDDGTTLAVGPLTCSAEHALLRGVRMGPARDHYANSALSWADVRAVDGQFGPWACGALRPDVTDEQVRALRGLALSGDWREDEQHRDVEMIAVLTVNAPGFPIEREAIAASGLTIPEVTGPRAVFEGDRLVAMVAAGIVERCPECAERAAQIRDETAGLSKVERRVAALERKLGVLSAPIAQELRNRVHVGFEAGVESAVESALPEIRRVSKEVLDGIRRVERNGDGRR